MHPVRVFSYLQKKIRLFVNLSVNISALWIEGFRLFSGLHDLLDNSGTQQHSCQDKSLEVLQNTSWGKGYYYDIQTKLHQSFFLFCHFFFINNLFKEFRLGFGWKAFGWSQIPTPWENDFIQPKFLLLCTELIKLST